MPEFIDPDGVFRPEIEDGTGENGPDRELRVLMPKSLGEPGDPPREDADGGRGGIWIFSCDPNKTILLSGLEKLLSLSSLRISTIPSPTPFESIFSQWCLWSVLGWGDLGFLSDQKGLPVPENVLLSSIEVGLITASESDKPFAEKLVKSLGELKNEEVGLLYLSVGDERGVWSDIRSCLLLTALDLFLRMRVRFSVLGS